MEYFIPREQKKTVVKHRGTAKKKKKKMQHATLGFVTRKESSLLREREKCIYLLRASDSSCYNTRQSREKISQGLSRPEVVTTHMANLADRDNAQSEYFSFRRNSAKKTRMAICSAVNVMEGRENTSSVSFDSTLTTEY